ncbi:MAG: tRNA-dihydrouridine synthase [Cloacibacillus evryensis]
MEVNMACPMPKVTKKGGGSRLMENPKEATAIMRRLKQLGLPVWAKVRIMPKNAEEPTSDFCERLFDGGADFVFVHGRTPAQRYEGAASRDSVEEVARLYRAGSAEAAIVTARRILSIIWTELRRGAGRARGAARRLSDPQEP